MRAGSLCLIALGLALAACHAQAKPRFVRSPQKSEVSARLQAVMAVDRDVVWASGLEGTVLRSSDGGASWRRLRVPKAQTLQFRDVHAFDDQRALVLSSGDGALSRIYKTVDGGASWTLSFENTEPEGFLDCFDFWDEQRGVAYGDSVAGALFILTTADGGKSWQRVDPKALPKALAGEGGFAASGGCVRASKGGHGWIGTGAGASARLLHSTDFGASWSARATPIVKGESAGIMSVVLQGDILVALGGDLSKPEAITGNVAATRDGGKTWRIGSTPTFVGAVYGASSAGGILVAVGPKGMSVSSNAGDSWTALDHGDFWSVDFGGRSRFWAVGPEGRILRFDLRRD